MSDPSEGRPRRTARGVRIDFRGDTRREVGPDYLGSHRSPDHPVEPKIRRSATSGASKDVTAVHETTGTRSYQERDAYSAQSATIGTSHAHVSFIGKQEDLKHNIQNLQPTCSDPPSHRDQHESKDHTTSLASSNHPVASEVARESDDVKSQLHAELTDIREALRQAEDKIHQLSSHHEEAVLENDRLHSQLEREKQAMIDLQLQASEQTSSRDHTIGSLQHQYRILEDAHKKNLDTLKQYEHYHRETQREMAAMAKERDQAVAKSLKLDAFDNSIDRVSEAQLVGEVRDVNTAIDDFVTALLEDATSVSEGASPASSDVLMTDVDHSEFFHMSLRVSPDSEAWGLLLDSLMHQKVLEHVHQVFLSTSFGIPEEGKLGESLLQLEHEVNKNETWRAAQRWRAMTATACFSSANSRIKTTHVAGIGHELRECLTIALRKPSNALDNMKEDIENKLVRIFEAAQHVGASASKGVVSARVRVILGSEHPTVVDNIWSDMGSVANDSIMGDYSFGLMKVGEQGQTSVLMRPKVTTQSLIRYVSKLEHP